jgi:hypothetical protein
LAALPIPSAPSRSAAIIIVIIWTKHCFSTISVQDVSIAKTKPGCQELSCHMVRSRMRLKNEGADE